MTAGDLLKKKGSSVTTIAAEATVLEAAEIMNDKRIGAVVVTRGERAVGIFTERDVLTRVVAAQLPPATTKLTDVMTFPMACCRRDTPVATCQSIMTGQRIRHLPVVEEGELHGLISAGDILASEAEQKQLTIEYLHDYLYHAR